MRSLVVLLMEIQPGRWPVTSGRKGTVGLRVDEGAYSLEACAKKTRATSFTFAGTMMYFNSQATTVVRVSFDRLHTERVR
jgi:hypothetical protein